MNAHTQDNALSEVIGLILTFAIIVMTMSVYITYMVPEKGKESEIFHMNEVRASFLELSYLIDSLWVNGKTGVSVSVPVTLHSSPESAIMPLFTPVSSQGFIAIAHEIETCTITFSKLVEQRVSNYSDVPLLPGESAILHENPQSTVLNFTPMISSNAPTDGIVATLGGKNSYEWQIDLKIRSALTNITIEDLNDSAGPPSLTHHYLHSLIAVERSSMLEYVAIDTINEFVSVDLKPVLDLFGVPLLNGSSLSFSSSGSNLTDGTPNLTISYPSLSPHDVSITTPLTELTFGSSNYYWIEQQYQYHKGGVFLRQEGNSTPLADIPFRIENESDSLVVSIVDIELHPKNNRVRSSGGKAQIAAEIHEIQSQLCDETGCYDTSDAMAESVEFTIQSPNEDTIYMWRDIFWRMCATTKDPCIPNVSPGQATLKVTASSLEKPIAVQYTKVDVNLEIRV